MDEHEHEQDYIIELTSEDGEVMEFEHLDTVMVNEQEYAVLVPHNHDNDEEEVEEIVILKIVQENGEDMLVGIDDETELEKAFDAFKEIAKEDYDFV